MKKHRCVLVRDRLNRIAAMMSAFCDEIAPISGAKSPCNPQMELFNLMLTITEKAQMQ